MPDDSVTLRAGDVETVIVPRAGGRIAQILVAGIPLLVDGLPDRDPMSTGWGCYPMTPWAGRIRNGRFSFGGELVQLDTNHVDGPPARDRSSETRQHHAIHGIGFQRRWVVDEHAKSGGGEAVRMSVDLDGTLRWPFGGRSGQRIVLTPTSVTCELSVTADDQPFPAEIGWHPWFRKPERLEFSPTAMYRRDGFGVTTSELVDVPPGPWDDCFTNTEPVRLVYTGTGPRAVTVASDCDHLVVYDEPEHATCVEPQSGPPDAANIEPRTLQPGDSLTRTMTIRWAPPAFTDR